MRCDPTGGSFDVTLPAAFNNRGQFITVKIVVVSGNTVTVTPQPGDTIDGGASFALSAATLASVTLVSDGISDWLVTANYV